MAGPPLILDLSRLLSRAERAVPTGIDRVELAYAEHLIAVHRDRLSFAGMLSWGRFGALRRDLALDLVATLGRVWRSAPTDQAGLQRAARLGRALRIERFWRGGLAFTAAPGAIYVLASHHHLDRPQVIAGVKQRTGARFACFIHDLIPLEFPEYARPGHDARHAVRMTTAAEHADLLIYNSMATRDAFAPFLAKAKRSPPERVALLGIDDVPVPESEAPAVPPYFVCVGTIEPRKNHLLLLNVWRQLATELGAAAPRLVLIGQRGWENENIVDMLERAPALKGLVEEHSQLNDAAVARLVKGACALLLPSFAEGYGLPVGEALALGVPVLCTPLPALREVAHDVAEYLDPLDGFGWRRAILDYMQPESARRAAQLARMPGWKAPTWAAHFAIVDELLASG
ncbi:MAG: glycosyltransferase family 4 protein [Alphaproteobacteria bacterium]|nr:glycosyltransferase family 4 protein [Alphaproteobacteria bacterium]